MAAAEDQKNYETRSILPGQWGSAKPAKATRYPKIRLEPPSITPGEWQKVIRVKKRRKKRTSRR
jgi:hypothetical protein